METRRTNPFHFKQFSVRQERSAMKVGTDGVLLGAWVPLDKALSILDIGTGTGLIAMMLAQRQPSACITGIDKDRESCEEARENVNASPWADRIRIFHTSLQEFADASPEKFDLIVSNPPYFNRSLISPSNRKTLARHDESLPLTDFVACSRRLLSKGGRLSLILPTIGFTQLKHIAPAHGFYEHSSMMVRAQTDQSVIRVMSCWGMKPAESVIMEQMTIESGRRHVYSQKYIELTREFYLKMT